MAWWNEMLTNTAQRLQVLGRITGKLEELGKMSFSGLGATDTGIIRIKPNNTGFQRWSGTAWVDVVLDIEKGGTGATTAEAARAALGITAGGGGSGKGTAIGEMNFSRELIIGQNTDVADRIVRVDGSNLRFRVASENYISTIAPVNQSEGSVAFRVLSSTGTEIVIGFIESVTVTNPSAGVTEVLITGEQMLGRGVLDRNLLPLIGSLNSTVTLELWRRGVAARDMSVANAVKLGNVDLTTPSIRALWRAALEIIPPTWDNVRDKPNTYPISGDGSTVTITNGIAVTTTGFHALDTEGSSAADELTHIRPLSYPTNGLLLLRSISSSRDITVRPNVSGVGRILLDDGNPFTFESVGDRLLLQEYNETWVEVSRSHLSGVARELARISKPTPVSTKQYSIQVTAAGEVSLVSPFDNLQDISAYGRSGNVSSSPGILAVLVSNDKPKIKFRFRYSGATQRLQGFLLSGNGAVNYSFNIAQPLKSPQINTTTTDALTPGLYVITSLFGAVFEFQATAVA